MTLSFDKKLCECKCCPNESNCDYFKDNWKAGIKEVVDWLNSHNGEPKKEPMWNAKLKEWGIEDK